MTATWREKSKVRAPIRRTGMRSGGRYGTYGAAPIASDFGKVRALVDEAVRIHSLTGTDEALDVVLHVPHVDVHAGDDPVVAQPERDELPRLDVSAVDDPGAGDEGRVARILHPQIVLVGVEVRDVVVRRALAEDRVGGDF